jgi:tetratricopeptide (TPR) repeat protein
MSERAENARAVAAELRLRGVAENNAGRPVRALRHFRHALKLLAASGGSATDAAAAATLRARVLISMAMSESELGGLERGLAALDPVRDYLATHSDPAVEVHLHCQIGYMQVRGGLFDEGLASLNLAGAMLDQVLPAEAANILLNRGMVHVFRGDLARARADYSRCIELSVRHGLAVEQAKARHNMGEVEFFAGNLAAALRLMDSANALGADVSRAVSLVDRSRVLIEAGLHREADDALREAGELFRADRLFKDVGEVELARAECALLDGEFAAARRLAGSARTRFRRRANDRWRRDAELVLLQADLAAGRPGLRLALPALRLAAEFREQGLATRARTARLVAAEALLRAGATQDAREAAADAGPIRPNDSMSARLHTRLVRATLQLANGERRAAGREIRTGLSELARHQSRFGSVDLQTASAVHGRQLAALDLGLALAEGNPSSVLAAVERGRSISYRLRSVVAPSDERDGHLLAELRQAVEELRGIESDVGQADTASALRRRIAEIQHALRSRAWHADGSGEADRPAAPAEVAAALDTSGSRLVCFAESEGRLHAVTLGGSVRSVVGLASSDSITELVRRVRADLDMLSRNHLPDAMRAVMGKSLSRSLQTLDELLLRPIALGDDPLVVLPTGPLATLPWGLLPSLRTRPVTVTPTATAWLAARGRKPAVSRSGVAVFTGPDLDFAETEAKAVARAWRTRAGTPTLYSGAASTQTGLLGAMGSASLVHIAAHGEHQAENPLFSSVRLSDGPVYAYEFDRSAAAPAHVVLSACELGQATIRPGDEALGLTSVLLHLGSTCVVSGVARVHDETAAAVMSDYHRALAAGLDSVRALADAVARTDGPPAPFVCFGADWAASGPEYDRLPQG